MKVRWWYSLLMIPMWSGWVTVIGLVHSRHCIAAGLDAQLASSGQELVLECRGPSWDAPVRGLNWVWPVEWEVGYWVAGAVVALLLTGSMLIASWRQRR